MFFPLQPTQPIPISGASPPGKQPVEGTSPAPEGDVDDFSIPEASPSFITVMNDLHVSDNEEQQPQLPLSPLVLADLPPNPFDFSHEDQMDLKPVKQTSPDPRRKRISSASTTTSTGSRARSFSWNHRHKMAMERRAKLQLPNNHSGPNSTNSSPLIVR